MTTIAASMRFRMIAADSKCSDDVTQYFIQKLRTGVDYARAAAGDWDKCLKWHELMEKGGTLDEDADDLDIEGMELRPDGIWVFEGITTGAKIKNEFYAIGTGAPYAIAGMHFGLSPKKAVALAALYDRSTGGEIDVWVIPDGKEPA